MQFLTVCKYLRKKQLGKNSEEPVANQPLPPKNLVEVDAPHLADIVSAEQAGIPLKGNQGSAVTVELNSEDVTEKISNSDIDLTHLGMRTFMGVLRALAKEDLLFSKAQPTEFKSCQSNIFTVDCKNMFSESKENKDEASFEVTYSNPVYFFTIQAPDTSKNPSKIKKTELFTYHSTSLDDTDRIFPILILEDPKSVGKALTFDQLVYWNTHDTRLAVGDTYGPCNFPSRTPAEPFQIANKRVFALLTFLFGTASVDSKDLPSQNQVLPSP